MNVLAPENNYMNFSLYIGHDDREAVGTHVFMQSLIDTAIMPVRTTILHKPILKRMHIELSDGSNVFTMSRFLVPWFENFNGWCLFMDGADMIMRGNIYDIIRYSDPTKAVQVVKHEYETKHPVKYRGTVMECPNEMYPRKNWASVMLINCNHYAWRKIDPLYIEQADKMHMLQFQFMEPKYVGELPIEWNWLADEYGENEKAKVLHWTSGVPGFPYYMNSAHADEWFKYRDRMSYAGWPTPIADML